MSNTKKKIVIIGSTSLRYLWDEHRIKREIMDQCEVKIACLDPDINPGKKALDIMKKNLELIVWADEIDFIWDARSLGAWGDFCMGFALGKKLNLVYLNDKTIIDCVKQYAEECLGEEIENSQTEFDLDNVSKKDSIIELTLE